MIKTVRAQIPAFLCGFALAASGVAYSQTTTNLVSETTFDSAAPSGWGFGYYYGNNGLGAQEYAREYYFPEDADMANAVWRYGFDLTDLAGTTGYGTGTGGPLYMLSTEPGALVSTNREDYIFSFDAKVEGLDPAQTSANAEMQVQFYYPDESNPALKTLQVNLAFSPTAEWKRFEFDLSAGGLGDNTSEANFTQHHLEVADVRFNVNLHEPDHAFSFDADNALYLDNVKLQVVNKPSVPTVPMVGVAIADWNFDDKIVDNEYHYQWSQNELQPVPTGGNNAGGNDPNTLGRDGTSGWWFTLDTTDFNNGVPQWAGGGSGGAGLVDYTRFDTNDLASYRVTFDARVNGLAEDHTNTAAVLQVFLDSPDDTLSPADDDANADAIIRLDVPISQVSSEWQTYSTTLNKAGVGGGSKANFIAAYNKISGLRTQWQIENATSLDWGFDADNTLIIDNFKLERLYPESSQPTLTIAASKTENNLVLTWNIPANGTVKLQSAATVNGQYSEIANAVSGYQAPMEGPSRFYRLFWSAQ